jgi:hypothetical protein
MLIRKLVSPDMALLVAVGILVPIGYLYQKKSVDVCIKIVRSY